ncbi:hypothetical protein D1115_18245 [Vibrio alfacsensis]|uniref:Fervidolysin-like N-terminal prodomain domain-containing protein n=1 Tax=Vibrio alfacsensis TaxID=1074311 RepID=A0ABN5PI62_9VIBR|nr:hypothetical protein [Vibrio alfacsensis]AXY02911.1 hypothetical protein D1115_18245 [Vibrio alfacsensis]
MNNIIQKIGIVLAALVLFASSSYAEPISTVETTSLELVSKSRSSRTTLDYTYRATFINNGSDANYVTGVVSSTSSAIQVIENSVAIGTLAEGIPTTSNDTFTLRIDRRTPFNSDALVWVFDAIDPISLDVGSTDIIINEGDSINQSYTVSYSAIDATNKTVEFSQQLTPINGVQITTTAPSLWSSSSTQDWIVNGTLSGTIAGQYTLTTTAVVIETGDAASVDTLITVLSADQPSYSLHAPLMAPSGIQLNQATEVFFSAQLDMENGLPAHLTLEEIDSDGNPIQIIGLLSDDGLDGDINANDGMYGATFLLTSNTEGNKYYRVSFFDGSQTFYTTLSNLAVVDFPTSTAVSNDDMLIESNDPLVKVYADHIIVSFKENISPQDIRNVVQEVGGTIVGSIPDLNIIQVGFKQKLYSELQALIDSYSLRSEVEFAEMSTHTDEVLYTLTIKGH